MNVFKRPAGRAHPILDYFNHHLYGCPFNLRISQPSAIQGIYLRANKWGRNQYQLLKYQLASAAHQDRKQYAELKESKAKRLINKVIHKALVNISQYALKWLFRNHLQGNLLP